MQAPAETRGQVLASALLMGLCVLSALPFTLDIPVDILRLGKGYPSIIAGDELIVWHDHLVLKWRWFLVIGAFLLPILTAGVVRGALSRDADSVSSGQRRGWMRRLWPVCLLPLVAAARLLADELPPALVSSIAFYLPLAVLAAILAPGWPRPAPKPESAGTDRRWPWAIGLAATVAFYSLGWYLAVTTGEHAGDEGHYLVQAESLYVDHDLDIKNQIQKTDPDDQNPLGPQELQRQHVAPNSKGGHWYSWHPYGLSLILAPFWKRGIEVRYLILAIISALGCLGMFRLSRRVGASPLVSVVATASLGGSCYWAIYSARALPEVLGATLLIWLFWAVQAQAERPWLATWVAAGCCAYLAPTHLRFLPLSLAGMGFFGLFGLCGRQSWPAKLVRLTVFTLVCGAGYAVFFAVQQQMFDGASYPVSAVLFSYPLGMWATIADVRGLVAVFPLFMWLGAAIVAWVVVDKPQRGLAAALLLTFLACLLTSCSNMAGIGGACLSGRYLVVVMPLLVPAAAAMLERSSAWARGWFLFLGLCSAMLLVQVVIRVPDIGRDFNVPVSALRNSPAWLGLFQPHCSFLEPTVHPFARHWVALYVIAGMAASGLLMLCPTLSRRWAVGALGVVLVTGGISHYIQAEYDPRGLRPREVARALLDLNLDRAVVIRSTTASSLRFSKLQIPASAGRVPAEDLQQPPDDWRYLDSSAVVAGRDTEGNSCIETLTDAGMDTRWSTYTGTTNFPALTFTFDRPVPLCGIRLLSPNGRYPRDVTVERQMQPGGRWETVLPSTKSLGFFWSGRQIVRDGVQFFRDLRFAVPTGGVGCVRVTFQRGSNPHVVCLGEVLFLEQTPPPEDGPPSFSACLAAIQAGGVKQFYGPRWVSDRLALATDADSMPQVPSLIPCTPDEWILYGSLRPCPVVLRGTTGFMMDRRDAERSRRVLRAVGLRWEEIPVGLYVLMVVPAPDPADDAARYPTLYWTETGCLAADLSRFASRKAHALYTRAIQQRAPENQDGTVAMLQKALEVCPAHEPARQALVGILRGSGRVEQAAAQEAILRAQQEPQVPARIRFSGGIEFLGLAISAQKVKPGGRLEITCFWRCPPSAESTRPTVFMHFVRGKALHFQDDHKLLYAQLPEDLRKQPFNEILSERRWVDVPSTVRPGDYEITIGLYNPKNKKRLRAVTDLPERREEVRLPVVLQVDPGS